MTNLELAERIKRDLNDLVDRGSRELVPLLIGIQSFIDDLTALKAMIAAINMEEGLLYDTGDFDD